ncbi:MAG: (2Fe-2S)-binding protein, partial [Planctomycetaceae bacterium]|nr:(2Fe-2S)-binding protein [Planctomycetaceae bacterium]
MSVTLTIDDQTVTVPAGTTLWQAAKAAGIDIPVLCHQERLNPVGVCRMCVVDAGERTLTASCVRACQNGMQVQTASPLVQQHRRMLTRLLLAEMGGETTSDVHDLGRQMELVNDSGCVTDPQLQLLRKTTPPKSNPVDVSSPVIAVNHAACIL